ncbi:MAG: Amuc_1099 family pilus-like system protein [Kiritimatiellia bacterium]
MNISEIKTWLKTAYDKVVLFVALFGLLLSLILLIVMVGREREKMAELSRKQEQTRNLAPAAGLLDMTFLDEGVEALLAPEQIPAWSNRLMTAELRVSCVKCGRPIPLDANVCPFRNCGAQQPAVLVNPSIKDSDLDAMPDEWEAKHGLNPNVDDANQDTDADGFANLEEYSAGADPRDPNSHPDYAAKLRVLKIGRMSMPLSFQGVQRLSTNDVRFLLQNKQLRRDTYAKLGDTVDGYKLVKYDEKKVKVKKGGGGTFEVEEDVSVLTVSRDNKLIPLTIHGVNQGEIGANLIFLVDQTKMVVKIGDVIKLKNNSYKIIDIKKDGVILTGINTGRELSVPPFSEADKQLYPGIGVSKSDGPLNIKP